MPRRAFISYPCDFPRNERVDEVCDFLAQHHCIVTIPPAPGWTYYSAMEDAIERCDTFVTVFDPIADGSTQLAIHLHYAASLQRLRWHPRPRIFGLWLGEPRRVATHDANVELLSAETYARLLEDLPPRNP